MKFVQTQYLGESLGDKVDQVEHATMKDARISVHTFFTSVPDAVVFEERISAEKITTFSVKDRKGKILFKLKEVQDGN